MILDHKLSKKFLKNQKKHFGLFVEGFGSNKKETYERMRHFIHLFCFINASQINAWNSSWLHQDTLKVIQTLSRLGPIIQEENGTETEKVFTDFSRRWAIPVKNLVEYMFLLGGNSMPGTEKL